LLSLEEAVEPLNQMLNDLDAMVDIAKENSKKLTDGLTPDESAAIHIYTMQWTENHSSLYKMLNSTLRSERRESLKPWFRYLKLILTALYKLPSLKTTVWRGVHGNLSDQYDDHQIWWGFSSCTESVDVMDQFLGKSGVRTLLNIECINGKAIRPHSFFKKENEILLMPGTYLRVVGKWSPAKDLYIIHLRETLAPRQYLEPPFTSPSTAASSSKTLSSTTDTPAMRNLIISKEKNLPNTSQATTQPKRKSFSRSHRLFLKNLLISRNENPISFFERCHRKFR
jgi:hypothetical protein